MLLLLGSVVWGLRPNSNLWGDGSGHQVESCGISIRLCKGIRSPPVPSSRVICRYQLLFLLGCLLDGDMGNYSAV